MDGEQAAVAIDVGDGDAEVGAPANSVEGEIPGVPEDDDPSQGALGAGVAALAALLSDAVVDDQVSTLHAKCDSVTICNGNMLCDRVACEQFGS